MAMVSMPFSVPSLNSHNLRPTRRCSGMAFATSNKEAVSPGVKITEGEGNLPKLVLTSDSGSEAEIYLFGGCITSWKVPSGRDLLFVRPDAVFNKKKPISGGIPHCFPQFGPGPMQQWQFRENGPVVLHPEKGPCFNPSYFILFENDTGSFRHGFARNMDWSLAESENLEGNPIVTLELKDGHYSRAMWDFSFHAKYKVILNAKSISTELMVTNTDNKPFSFSTALHTYFHASITGVSVRGLKGCKTLNKDQDPKNPIEGSEERDVITFPGFVDCVYLDAPEEVYLDNGLGDIIAIRNKNWSDAVLWNPHLQMEACYKDFVCVENAKIRTVPLEPEQSWIAKQHLSIA